MSSPLGKRRTVREFCTPDWSEEAYTQVVCGVYGFYVNGELISSKIGDRSFVDMDGNFRKRVEFKGVNGKLSIILEMGVEIGTRTLRTTGAWIGAVSTAFDCWRRSSRK